MTSETNVEQGDERRAVVERLVREGLPIAESMARRIFQRLGGALGQDELLGLAHDALVNAVRDYDPARAPFAPYLVMKLKWGILEEVRKHRRRRRAAARATASCAIDRMAEAEAPAGVDAGPTTEAEDQAELSDFLSRRAAALAFGLASAPRDDRGAVDAGSPEDRLMGVELRRDILSAVERLPVRQRALVMRYYFGDESFDAIASDIGISKSWASRLHAQAMASLADTLRPLR